MLMTFVDSLNKGLDNILLNNKQSVILGEDVGKLGGVFRVTKNLQSKYGVDRVIDAPLSENGIIGMAIGMAYNGYLPICEIQFDGFIYPAFDQIVSQMAKISARSEGDLKLNMIIRIPVGGEINGVEHHSESPESYLLHTKGLEVVIPSTPNDAYWMLQYASECNNPVFFLEPKKLYWQKDEVDFVNNIDFKHKSITIREGIDCLIITYGAMVSKAITVADLYKDRGLSIEIIDLRYLYPLDIEHIIQSVNKIGRVLILHEANQFLGFGAEISAQINERCFASLKAPILRVSGLNIPYPPSVFEGIHIPSIERIVINIERLLSY